MNTKRSTSPRLLLLALATALIAVFSFVACSDECDELRRDVDDLRLRVEKLEDWCNTANSQISALQGLVAALEANDYVTGITPITEGARETGYTIQFSKSGPITIHHGKDGTNGTNGSDGKDGTNGLTPLIGAAKDTDGLYYWTVKTGDDAPQWLTDAEGNKIPTTGKDGADGSDGADGTDAQPPVISVATFEGALYWQVNGQWLLDSNNAKVPATGPAGPQGPQGDQGIQGPEGPQGDAVFAPDGVTVDDENGYVTFTLADKVTTFRLPLYVEAGIRFTRNEIRKVNFGEEIDIRIRMPLFFHKSKYRALKAEVVTADGNVDIVTRGASGWTVKLTPPKFYPSSGVLSNDPWVKIIVPQNSNLVGTKALLRATLVYSDGQEFTATCVLQVTDAIFYNYTIEGQLTVDGTRPSGAGTANDPFHIKTKEELQWLKMRPKEAYYYKLEKDIEVTGFDSQGNWVPIGWSQNLSDGSFVTNAFQGKFDGNGKKVSGIVAPAGYEEFGFFGYCKEAEIRNLTYEGSMDLSRLDDRTGEVGAIAGLISDGTVTHCSNSADLTCKGSVSVGGIVGRLSSTSQTIGIEACTNTGNIETKGDAGGIAGVLTTRFYSLIGCINTGNIKTDGYGGGIVGKVDGAIIACWSSATSITHQSNNRVGGIIGGLGDRSRVELCFWKDIPGMKERGYSFGLTIIQPPVAPFTGDRPNAETIVKLNNYWRDKNNARKYRFNATSGEIEEDK